MVLVAHGWFMLIVIASYTANLASFLTAAEAVPILNSWNDVVKSKGAFKLALPRGLTHEGFIASESARYPDARFNILWTDTWEEAFEQVKNGTVHATFHDEPVAQDFIMRSGLQCDMIEVGKTFNGFGYGFAFNYDSTNFIAFSQAIVYLKETGLIDQLLVKYNVGPVESGAADACGLGGGSDTDQMSWDEMAGLMIMVAAIIIVGFIINFVERIAFRKSLCPCCVEHMPAGHVWERLHEKPTGNEIHNAELAEALRNGKFHFSEEELDRIKKTTPELSYSDYIRVDNVCYKPVEVYDRNGDGIPDTPKGSKFSRRMAARWCSDVAADQREEDRQALALALRTGVRAGVIEAVMKVAKDNAHKVKISSANSQYKAQVKAMLDRGGDEESKVARWRSQQANGSNPGEKALVGSGGVLDLGDAQLAQVHQVLAEWL